MRKIEVKPGYYEWDAYVDDKPYYSFEGINLAGEILGCDYENDDFPAGNVEEITEENIKTVADMYVDEMLNVREDKKHWGEKDSELVRIELTPAEISELKTQLAMAWARHFDVCRV